MAIIKHSTFALVLSAIISVSVNGQTNINFDVCKLDTDDRTTVSETSFDTGRDGSQRRTYGNLCTHGGTTDDIPARSSNPFTKFCDLIDDYDNVKALMSTGVSSHTVFAPTDAAFAKVEGLISRVDEERLLELHILPTARLTRDLRCDQTYRTINTQQDRRNNQRSKTRCINASRAQQLGPGNVVNGLKPTIGVPDTIFNRDEFNQDTFVIRDNAEDTFGQDVISCNGVIHVVDEVLLPGGQNTFRNQGYYNGGLNYNGNPQNLANYYTGASHTHPTSPYYGGVNGGHLHGGYYYGGYYGGRHDQPLGNGPIYYNGYGVKGAKGFKKGKKNKGYPLPQLQPQRNANPYYVFRKLDTKEDADADERFMSDAEFFGTNGAKVEGESSKSEEDLSNRKRRLEAFLEPDGNIAQA